MYLKKEDNTALLVTVDTDIRSGYTEAGCDEFRILFNGTSCPGSPDIVTANFRQHSSPSTNLHIQASSEYFRDIIILHPLLV